MKHRTLTMVRRIVTTLAVVGVALMLVVSGVLLLWASTLPMPTIEMIHAQRKEHSTKIYDRTGTVLLYDTQQDVHRTVVPLAQISDSLKHATIAIEDERFYQHFGIEPASILRAVFHNIQTGHLLSGQGGSTLTQQVVKNSLLTNEKSISRKLKEWVLAIKLERELSKDQILELYLNEVPYGGTLYGAEEASEGFFGKHANELTVAESAYLAALPQAPTYYAPSGAHRSALEDRKNTVLTRMHEQGYISNDEFEAAKKEQVTFLVHANSSIKAPHFVFFILSQLATMYGDSDLSQANLKVTTTLDWELEREAENIVHTHALENEKNFKASNASLMAIDPKTGEILVMVGSRDYFDKNIEGNFNIGLAVRQPGSAFKPFAYATALSKGYTTETVVWDVATQFSTACDKTNLTSDNDCYAPTNYDGAFRGPMTFREALAQSVNVPAVKVLYLAGMRDTFDVAQRMGISTLGDYRRYGLTLVLGGGEVSLLEMTSAYGTFANEGMRYPYTAIREVADATGKIIFRADEKGEQVIDPDVARSVTNMLADNAARTPAFGSNSYLFIPDRDVAVKTGTTNDYRDTWIIGYTPTIAVGAWAGNNNNAPMEKKVAGFIIAPLWNEFMLKYFELHPDKTTFTPPAPIDPSLKPILRGYKYTGAPLSTTASSSDTDTQPGTSSPANLPLPHSILYYVLKNDPRGPYPADPSIDPQFAYWEYGILKWRMDHGASLTELATQVNQSSHGGGTTPEITITKPETGSDFRKSDTIHVNVNITSATEIRQVTYLIDGKHKEIRTTNDLSYSFSPRDLDLRSGRHTLTTIVEDVLYATGSSTIAFTVQK